MTIDQLADILGTQFSYEELRIITCTYAGWGIHSCCGICVICGLPYCRHGNKSLEHKYKGQPLFSAQILTEDHEVFGKEDQ